MQTVPHSEPPTRSPPAKHMHASGLLPPAWLRLPGPHRLPRVLRHEVGGAAPAQPHVSKTPWGGCDDRRWAPAVLYRPHQLPCLPAFAFFPISHHACIPSKSHQTCSEPSQPLRLHTGWPPAAAWSTCTCATFGVATPTGSVLHARRLPQTHATRFPHTPCLTRPHMVLNMHPLQLLPQRRDRHS